MKIYFSAKKSKNFLFRLNTIESNYREKNMQIISSMGMKNFPRTNNRKKAPAFGELNKNENENPQKPKKGFMQKTIRRISVPLSLLLSGALTTNAVIQERKIGSLKEKQEQTELIRNEITEQQNQLTKNQKQAEHYLNLIK